MSEDFPRGRFVWYQLNTTDPDAARSFYTALVGWGAEIFEGAGAPYPMWTNQGTPLGGVMELPEEATKAGAPPHWLAHVATPDVDATAARAQELGGNVMVPPSDIPDVGRFAVIADSQGAVFAVYAPGGEAPGHDEVPRVGEFSWHELITSDHEAAWEFYSDLFGWQKTEAMDMGEMGTYQMYGRNLGSGEVGPPLGGMFNKSADMPGPPAWLLYVRIDDVNAGVERVKELGGQVLNGPMEVPDGDLVAQCLDPQGAAFAVHSTAG